MIIIRIVKMKNATLYRKYNIGALKIERNKTERVRSGPGRGDKFFVLYEYITS